MTPRPPKPLPIADPEEIRSALDAMQERDRRVVELRYGLRDGQPRSRAEIGQLLGISRERVRQLEGRALERLRGEQEHHGARSRRPAPGPPAPTRQSFLRAWTFLLLWLSPDHVYELKARLRELGLPPATYRMLQGLEREGFLRSTWAPGRGAGPNRRVYSLTPLGVEQLHRDLPGMRKMAETLDAFLADKEFRPREDTSAE